MTIDDPALTERTFTETHDRILHALVEQVHDMGLRLAALEAAAVEPGKNKTPTLAPPAVPTSRRATKNSSAIHREGDVALAKQPVTKQPSARAAGWQPARS